MNTGVYFLSHLIGALLSKDQFHNLVVQCVPNASTSLLSVSVLMCVFKFFFFKIQMYGGTVGPQSKAIIQSMQLYCMEVFVEFMLVMGITWGLGEVCQSC